MPQVSSYVWQSARIVVPRCLDEAPVPEHITDEVVTSIEPGFYNIGRNNSIPGRLRAVYAEVECVAGHELDLAAWDRIIAADNGIDRRGEVALEIDRIGLSALVPRFVLSERNELVDEVPS